MDKVSFPQPVQTRGSVLTPPPSRSDVCKPCRDRKFAKCGGVFQKRTLSSNCQCGMSLADHNITSHLASQTPQCESRRPSETKPPAAFSGYDWEDVPNAGSDERSTQPTVPPGAQGAWDINSPQRQPDSGKGAITPEKFTDIPDPYNLQVRLPTQDSAPPPLPVSRHHPCARRHNTRSRPIVFVTPPEQATADPRPCTQLGLEESPPFNGGPGGASQQDQERQQKSMQAEKLLTKVQDRLLKGGTDCDTLAQLAGMLQQERSEKEGLWERYRNLEQQMEATVQHVVNVMGDDKRRLKERIDMLEGGLNQLDADKRNLAQRLGAADAKSGQLASKVTSLTSEGIAAKQRGEKLASHARNAYGFIKQTMEEAEKQASASEHGAQVSSIIRARIVEELAVAGERGKRIDGIADRVDKACEAARVRADDHAELEVHREEAVRRIDALMMEREELLLRQEDLREEVAGMGREAKMAQDEADRVKADLARARGVWEAGRELQREQEGSAAERRADAAERRAMSAESRAKAAEEALGEALAALEMQEKLALLGGCGPPPQQHKVEQHWSVQKGGIKVLRLGSQGSQGQLINSIAGSASMAGTPGPHRDTSNVPAVYQSCPNGVGVGGGQRMGDVWSSGVSSRRDMWPAGGVEELVGAEIGKDEVTKLGEMAEGSFGIVYRCAHSTDASHHAALSLFSMISCHAIAVCDVSLLVVDSILCCVSVVDPPLRCVTLAPGGSGRVPGWLSRRCASPRRICGLRSSKRS